MFKRFSAIARPLLLLLFFLASGCSLLGTKPTIAIVSPPHGSQYHEGDDVAVQATATDTNGVVRVELVVDGAIVRTDSPPGGVTQSSFTLIQNWKAVQGTHTLAVRAYNGSNTVSDLAAISVTVLPATIAQQPTPPPTTAPATLQPPAGVPPTLVPPTVPPLPPVTSAPLPCANNSGFVADISIPDGTTLGASQTFAKVWRLRNTGTCAWTSGYQLVFVAGEAMTTSLIIPVPDTAPGAMVDLLVPMTSSSAGGSHTGQWRLSAPTGALFGVTVSVVINVGTAPTGPTDTPAPPGACSGTPNIASFTAAPLNITPGASSVLTWGAVTNASYVEINQGVGPVASPGTRSVSPATTTVYTMTARCGTNTWTALVTVTVGAALPDLRVTAINFNPATAAPGVAFQVRISIANTGPAVPNFAIRLLQVDPGGSCPTGPGLVLFDRTAAIGANGTIDFTQNVAIASAGDYSLCANLDNLNAIPEANESNNWLARTVTVGLADLRAFFVGFNTYTPHVGDTIGANITIYNEGNVAAPSFNVRLVQLNLGGAICPGPGVVLFDRMAPGIPAHGSNVFSQLAVVQPPAGDTRMCVILDHMNNVPESNKSNNSVLSDVVHIQP